MLKRIYHNLKGETYKNKYRVSTKIISTYFSDLYDAENKQNGRPAVVKILNEVGQEIARRLQKRKDALWEGELLYTVDHPNIVNCYDFVSGKKFWLAMEKLETTLPYYIKENFDRLSHKRLIHIFSCIARAIDHLHRKRLIHGDLSPDNVMVDKKGSPKLIDFGLTMPHKLPIGCGRMGTPGYMSPEMIRERTSDFANDTYSLGIIMYECITGTKLFSGRMKEERMSRILNFHPPSPSKLELKKHCSAQLAALVIRCLSKESEKRPSDIKEIIYKLDTIAKD